MSANRWRRALAAGDCLIAARDWQTVYRLPPYAHELNPVEPVWSHLKRSLANLAKRNLSQLTALIKTRLGRIQYRPGLLGGFLAHAGLDLTPSGGLPSLIGRSTAIQGRPICAFVQPCEARAVGAEHVRFGRCPVVVDR